MPISFEPAQPFAPGINAAFGAAETWSRNLPALTQLYGQGNRLAFESGQADADRRLRASLAHAEFDERERLQTQALQFRQREGADELAQRRGEAIARMQPSERDLFLAQNENLQQTAAQEARLQQQQQMAQLQASLQQQELSFKENIRLQEMRNRLAEVMSADFLSDEEKMQAAFLLKTNIDPLELRQRNAQTQKLELAKQQMADQMAFQRVLQSGDQQAITQAFGSRVIPADPMSGRPAGYINSKGDWEPLGSGGGKAAEDKPFDNANALKQAQAEADVAYPPRPDEITGKPSRTEENVSYMQQVWQRLRGEFDQTRMGRQQQGPAQGMRPPQQQAAPPAPGSVPAMHPRTGNVMKPYKVGEPETPEQKRVVAIYGDMRDRMRYWVGRSNVPEKLPEYEAHMDELLRLDAAYGSPAGMPEAVRARYNEIRSVFDFEPIPKDKPPATPGPIQGANPFNRGPLSKIF